MKTTLLLIAFLTFANFSFSNNQKMLSVSLSDTSLVNFYIKGDIGTATRSSKSFESFMNKQYGLRAMNVSAYSYAFGMDTKRFDFGFYLFYYNYAYSNDSLNLKFVVRTLNFECGYKFRISDHFKMNSHFVIGSYQLKQTLSNKNVNTSLFQSIDKSTYNEFHEESKFNFYCGVKFNVEYALNKYFSPYFSSGIYFIPKNEQINFNGTPFIRNFANFNLGIKIVIPPRW